MTPKSIFYYSCCLLMTGYILTAMYIHIFTRRRNYLKLCTHSQLILLSLAPKTLKTSLCAESKTSHDNHCWSNSPLTRKLWKNTVLYLSSNLYKPSRYPKVLINTSWFNQWAVVVAINRTEGIAKENNQSFLRCPCISKHWAALSFYKRERRAHTIWEKYV